MSRENVYNFSAGPSVMPAPVLEKAADELLDYGSSGMSVMEMSHRSKLFQDIFESTREKELVFSHKTTYDGPIIPSEELDGGRFWSLEEIRSNIGKEIFTPNFENEFQKLGF